MSRLLRKSVVNNKKFKKLQTQQLPRLSVSTISEDKKQEISNDYLKETIKRPNNLETDDEWIALKTFDFFNEITLIFDAISTYCTTIECPDMKIGNIKEFFWIENKKKIKLCANDYIIAVLEWIDTTMNDTSKIPDEFDKNKYDGKKFKTTIKKINQRLLRIYLHIIYKHLNVLKEYKLYENFFVTFSQFQYFCLEFKLVEEKEFNCISLILDKQ